MSNEYRELIDRLARARNFKGGAYILITSEPEDTDAKIAVKGDGHTLLTGIVGAIETLFENADVKTQEEICDALVKLVSDNQTKRFQESERKVEYD